jgi:hypothetical protein
MRKSTMFANRARVLIGSNVLACLATLLAVPSPDGAAAAADPPGWKPFLTTEVFDRLLKEELKTIVEARKTLGPVPASRPRTRAAVGRIRSSALLIAAAAQSYKGKHPARQVAILRDTARNLAAVADEHKVGQIDKYVRLLTRFPKLATQRELNRPADFAPDVDLADIMGIFALPPKGGLGIERELERLPNYSRPATARDMTPKLELDGYRIALVGRMMRHGLEGVTPGPGSPLGAADWDQWSDYLYGAGLELAGAVRARDGQKVSDRVGDLHATCVSCHNLYAGRRGPDFLAATRSAPTLLTQLQSGVGGEPETLARAFVRRCADNGSLERAVAEVDNDTNGRARVYLRHALDYYAARGDVPVVAGLLQVFSDAAREDSRQAARALGRSALRPLLEVPGVQRILIDADGRVFTWFARHAGGGGTAPPQPPGRPGAVRLPELLQQHGLKDRDPAVRITAAALLVELGVTSKDLVPAVEASLTSADAHLRGQAVQLLRRLEPSASSIPSLVRSLRDPDPVVRGRASIALSRIGKAAVAALICVLKDHDGDARVTACSALGRIGSDAKEAVPALLTLYKGPDAYQRKLAALALKKIDPKAIATGRP